MRRDIYPKPGPIGGKLIRRVIRAIDALGLARPLQGPVRLAVSGGADSVALAVLIARYGRRVAPKSEILHLNHHWRGRESGQDQRFVRHLAQSLGVKFTVRNLSPHAPKGASLEAWGREQRHKVFARFSRGWILFAHHAEDQAETVLWRILSGAPRTQWAGIYPENGRILRPFLGCSRSDLRAFLKEEGWVPRSDRSNEDGRFLRVQIRKRIAPSLDRVFPAWKEALTRVADQARGEFGKNAPGKTVPARDSRR